MQNRKNRPAKKVSNVAKEITKNQKKEQVKSEIPVVKPKPTQKPKQHTKPKPQPKVKTVEKDKSTENINVKIVSDSVQSEIKTVISETPKINVVQQSTSEEVRENLEPIKVAEVILPKQTELKEYDLGNVTLNIIADNCGCADKVGYDYVVEKKKEEKVGFFTKLINKIKSYLFN